MLSVATDYHLLYQNNLVKSCHQFGNEMSGSASLGKQVFHFLITLEKQSKWIFCKCNNASQITFYQLIERKKLMRALSYKL